jgi:hypothetical protein
MTFLQRSVGWEGKKAIQDFCLAKANSEATGGGSPRRGAVTWGSASCKTKAVGRRSYWLCGLVLGNTSVKYGRCGKKWNGVYSELGRVTVVA